MWILLVLGCVGDVVEKSPLSSVVAEESDADTDTDTDTDTDADLDEDGTAQDTGLDTVEALDTGANADTGEEEAPVGTVDSDEIDTGEAPVGTVDSDEIDTGEAPVGTVDSDEGPAPEDSDESELPHHLYPGCTLPADTGVSHANAQTWHGCGVPSEPFGDYGFEEVLAISISDDTVTIPGFLPFEVTDVTEGFSKRMHTVGGNTPYALSWCTITLSMTGIPESQQAGPWNGALTLEISDCTDDYCEDTGEEFVEERSWQGVFTLIPG